MNEHAFGYLEHTADKGVFATGRTLEEAFENLAYGMFCLMADLFVYKAVRQHRVLVEGQDEVELLRHWLKELLFVFEVDKVLPVGFHIRSISGGTLVADIDVRPFGSDIEWLGSAVKAVTYHGMAVEKTGDGYRVQAIVDV